MKKRSVTLGRHSTSITLEEEFWQALKDVAVLRGLSVNKLIEDIDADAGGAGNLSSAIRVFVLKFYKL